MPRKKALIILYCFFVYGGCICQQSEYYDIKKRNYNITQGLALFLKIKKKNHTHTQSEATKKDLKLEINF